VIGDESEGGIGLAGCFQPATANLNPNLEMFHQTDSTSNSLWGESGLQLVSLMAQQSGGGGPSTSAGFRPSATITSSQDHCLATMKQETLDPPPLLGLSNLEASCPPLSSLTASIEAKDCDMDGNTKDDDREDSRHAGGGKLVSRSRDSVDQARFLQLRLVESGLRRGSSPSPASPDTQLCSSTTQSSFPQLIKDEEEQPKRSCLVCGDVASGFHYGVSSCEACKAFFKRTIQGNIEYTCPVSNACEINKRRRKACQACRYQKCLRQGMLKEGVRLDRVRGGRQKYRRYPMDGHGPGSMMPTRKVSLEENRVLEALVACEPEALVSLEDAALPASPLKTVSILSDVYDRELVATIGWAKQVPGFTDLTLNDQMKLLQSSWTEVLTLTLVYRSLPKLGSLKFATDFSLSQADCSRCGLDQFFDKCMLIVERLERLSVTKEEFLILKALVIANSDCPLEEFGSIERVREGILSSLHDAVFFIRCGDAALHLQNLLLVLPSLRDADTVLRMFWSQVKQEGRVPMNKLLVEMLEANTQ